MQTRRMVILILAAALTAFLPGKVQADGIIIPEPPHCELVPCPPMPLPMAQLEIRYHRVNVTIENQVALTRVDQVFYNPNDWTVEGIYIFPLPRDAAVADFTLWVDGKPVKGEVMDAAEARRTYQEIVNSLRDPALLEYADQGAVKASIFPIPPQGERRIQLEYSQVLSAENGLVRYSYPLNTEKFSAAPLEEVSVNVEVSTSSAVRAVYSPSHTIDIEKEDDRHFKAGYEAKQVRPDTDFLLYYSTGENEAFHLLSFRNPGDPVDSDGFFLALLAPRPGGDQREIPKDVILILDRSGSMEGEKFEQAQKALLYILDHLNPDDRFNVIAFSTGLETFAESLQPASRAGDASKWVEGLSAKGSTDINRALLEAAGMADSERPAYTIFLTDGLPTVGELNSQKILSNLASDAPENLRLFVFGVGYDVDTFLLDSLAGEHHGASTYVLPADPLDEVLSAFYEKISAPVLTNLDLDFGEMTVFDIYPDPLPDLFLGSQVIAVGRYRKGGTADITLSGEVQGERQTFRFARQNFDVDSRGDQETLAGLPRLWATRKVGALLNQVRLEGPDAETVAQIVKLSIRYGIVTPYTSYLVTEDTPLGAGAQERIANDQLNRMQATAPVFSGEGAVQKAAREGAMAGAEAPLAAPAEAVEMMRIASGRTFVLSGGVWTDTAFDPEKDTLKKIAFLSDQYFELAAARPDMAPILALGQKVIFSLDGEMVEITATGETSDPIEIQPVSTETPLPAPGVTPMPGDENPTPVAASPTPVSPVQPKSASPICPAGAIPVAALLGMVVVFKKRRDGEV